MHGNRVLPALPVHDLAALTPQLHCGLMSGTRHQRMSSPLRDECHQYPDLAFAGDGRLAQLSARTRIARLIARKFRDRYRQDSDGRKRSISLTFPAVRIAIRDTQEIPDRLYREALATTR